MRGEGDARVVQFPHPGKEHKVGVSGVRTWPSGEKAHRRTFLQSAGLSRTSIAGPDTAGELAFWGEWEGQARLVAELDPTPEGPRYLCAPDPTGEPPASADGTPSQNTDPFVWGDTMAYVGCRQPSNQKLRGLGRGSLILFGSDLAGRFVLDTVFVVAGWIEHDCDNYAAALAGVASDAHMRAGVAPFHGWRKRGVLRYYAGANPGECVSGMFSFVPCRPIMGSHSGFARPAIRLDGFIAPNIRQQARSSDPLAVSEIAQLWRHVVNQVAEHELALATRLDLVPSAETT